MECKRPCAFRNINTGFDENFDAFKIVQVGGMFNETLVFGGICTALEEELQDSWFGDSHI